MSDKLIIAILVFAIIGFVAVLARLWKLVKMMRVAKERYEAALQEFKEQEAVILENYDFFGDLGDKIKNALLSVFNKVVKPFKDLYEWIREQIYEIVPFLVFQLFFLGFLIYWSIIPPHKNFLKQSITYAVIVILLTGVIGIGYGFWWAFKYGNKDDTYGAYLLRKEIAYLQAIKNMSVDIFYALTGKKKEGFSFEGFGSCFM